MITSNQIKTRLGKDLAGVPHYDNLQTLITGKLPVESAKTSTFVLAADADVKTLATGEYEAGNVYIDGTTFEGINGGVIAATVAALGTADLAVVELGGRPVSLVKILDAGNDDALKIEKQSGSLKTIKMIYGLVQTDLTEGAAIVDDKTQLSFVTYDDVAGKFEAYTLPKGTYKFQTNTMFNMGSAAAADKLEGIFSAGQNIAGYSYEELAPIMSDVHGNATIKFDKEHQLTGKKVKVVFTDNTATAFKDSADVALTGAQFQQTDRDTLKFDAVNDIGKTLVNYAVDLSFNGVGIEPAMAKIVDATTVEIDLSNTIFTDTVYIDDTVSVKW